MDKWLLADPMLQLQYSLPWHINLDAIDNEALGW